MRRHFIAMALLVVLSTRLMVSAIAEANPEPNPEAYGTGSRQTDYPHHSFGGRQRTNFQQPDDGNNVAGNHLEDSDYDVGPCDSANCTSDREVITL